MKDKTILQRAIVPDKRIEAENTHSSATPKKSEKRKKAAPPMPATEKANDTNAKNKRLAYLIFTAVTALMVIVMAVVLRNVSDTRSYNNYMERAQTCFSAGDMDTALAYLRKANSVDATDNSFLMMANCYEAQGNYKKAIETLRLIKSDEAGRNQRISSLEERMARMAETGMIYIAGKQYSAGTTGLVLDNMGLTDSVLVEIQQLYSLDNLSISGNGLSDISGLSGIAGLTTLNLSDNSISDISAISSLSALRTLYLDNNPINDLSPLYSLLNLSFLSIKGIGITESQLKAISQALPSCAIHSETAEREAQDISIGGYTFKNDVTELDLSNLGLRDVSTLSACKNLSTLNLSGNELGELSGIMDIPRLEYLNISYNNISDLRPLMGMSTLKIINASGNSISNTVPLNSLPGLTELYLDNNPINNFSGLRNLHNLATLSLNNTGIRNSDLSYLAGLSHLTALNVLDNTELTGEAVDELKMQVPTCTVSHSQLAYSIEIDGNYVASDTAEMDLSGRGVTDISGVSRLDKLIRVNLARNNISNIYPFQFCSSSQYLTYLDLSSNYLEDITPISSMFSLETLDISYNNISLIGPILGLTNLRTLRVTGNPMTQEQIAEIQAALPLCEIITQ